TLLCWAGLLVDKRRRTQAVRPQLAISSGIVAALVVSRTLFRLAARRVEAPPSVMDPLDLLLTSFVAASLVWLAIELIEGRRLVRPRARLLDERATPLVAIVYLGVGALDAALLWMYGRFLQSVVS